MAQFKVIVQILKEIKVEANDATEAKEKAKHEIVKLGITDRFNVQEPANLSARKEKSKKFFKEKAAKKKEAATSE